MRVLFLIKNYNLIDNKQFLGKSEIIVKANDENAYSNYSFIQTEWQLLKVTNASDEINGFVWLEYSLFLKRNYVVFGIFCLFKTFF